MTLKLEVGKTYFSSKSDVVRIVAVRKVHEPLMAEFIGLKLTPSGSEIPVYYFVKGTSPNPKESPLLKEYKESTYFWQNIYPSNYLSEKSDTAWSTKEDANTFSIESRIALIRVCNETGEVLQEVI